MKTMKTCKMGCGKMKSGGPVKKVKKMQKGGELYGMPQENLGTSGQYGFAKKGGIIKKKSGGPLKPVDKSNNPGLAKLPTAVRNKMGYMKKGGVKKK